MTFDNKQYAVLVALIVCGGEAFMATAYPFTFGTLLVLTVMALSYFGPQLLDEIPPK